LWDVEAPTFSLDNRLTDCGEVVSLTRQPPFTPQEDSWYSYLLGRGHTKETGNRNATAAIIIIIIYTVFQKTPIHPYTFDSTFE
jgi:hypothetical protein